MGKEQTGLLAALWHYMSEHFCVPVFTHFACRYYTSRQELASQEPLPGHSPLFELGPAIQRLGLGCMPLAPTPFQMTTTTTTIPTTKIYRFAYWHHLLSFFYEKVIVISLKKKHQFSFILLA